MDRSPGSRWFSHENWRKVRTLQSSVPPERGGQGSERTAGQIVPQKTNRLFRKVRVKRWGKSPPRRILLHPSCMELGSHLSLRLLPGDWTDEQPFPCSVLHCERFTLPPRLPSARWALTPTFHPYLPKKAVCFLRYYLSSGPLGPLSLPFKRHTAL